MATSTSSHSLVKTDRTLPPVTTRSAGSSPRATAIHRGFIAVKDSSAWRPPRSRGSARERRADRALLSNIPLLAGRERCSAQCDHKRGVVGIVASCGAGSDLSGGQCGADLLVIQKESVELQLGGDRGAHVMTGLRPYMLDEGAQRAQRACVIPGSDIGLSLLELLGQRVGHAVVVDRAVGESVRDELWNVAVLGRGRER